ncbi:MAG TPA: hypothetical protein VMM83_06590 [Longimicrobiales bacterium]|nr:hypothetical protein [Longimicrobiales bacterium]
MEQFIPIFLFMCIAGVLILRPVTRKLGLLIEAMAKERLAETHTREARFSGLDDAHVDRVASALDRLNARMDRIDDRIGFMERLLENRPPSHQRLTG